MGTFNTYGNKSRKYGGSSPVWLTVSQKERCGCTLSSIPAGNLLRAGTLIHIDHEGGYAYPIPTYKLGEGSVPSPTKLILHSPFFRTIASHTALIVVDDELRKERGCNFLNEVKSYKYDENKKSYIIEFKNPHGFQEGEILIECSYQGNTSYDFFFTPAGLTENDVWMEDGDEFATVASVFHGEIMEDRIQPIPAYVKKLLPMIKFQKGL